MTITSTRPSATAAFLVLPLALAVGACEAPDVDEAPDVEEEEEAEVGLLIPDAVPIPENEAAPFFDEIQPVDGLAERPSFSADGRQIYLAHRPDGADLTTVYRMEWEDGAWQPANPLPLPADDDLETPFLSPDGTFLFFATTRDFEGDVPIAHYNIWATQQVGEDWGEPVPLPGLNSMAMDTDPALSADANLVFASERGGPGLDLYLSELEGGRYTTQEPLDEVNSPADDRYPYFDPDERFILFASDRENPGTAHDIYITYQDGDGWTEPEPLNDLVNTDADEYAPTMSPDGRYLFFNRGDQVLWVTAEAAGIDAPEVEEPEVEEPTGP